MTQQIRQIEQPQDTGPPPKSTGTGTSTSTSTNITTSTNGTNKNHSKKNPIYTPSLKWIQQIRALPSKPNDSLQLEFVIDNLDNSRKLIGHVNEFTDNAEEFTNLVDERINGGLLRLNQVKFELDWLE